MNVPVPSAPFAEKMAYYRDQHSSEGVKATHLIGIPTLLLSLPLLAARPRIGLPMFIGGWGLQIAGHRIFEHNTPALSRGPVTYQLTGLAFWCEEVGELLARLNRRAPRVRRA
jgi:uncharacterized membrane protein YGL010W